MRFTKSDKFKHSLFIAISMLSIICNGQTPFICNYLNEPAPGKTPVLFGKGVVSVEGENTHACTFSPDGNMLIFSRYPERKSYIMTFSNDHWTNPIEAFFEGKETSFSADGTKVFYYKTDGDIYFNEKTESGWGISTNAGTAINTSETEYYPSVTNDGTLFFSRNGQWNQGRIMYSTYTDGKYNTPVDIGLPVNTGGALHEYVAPDKRYMIFNSPRTGSFTQCDLWISFHNADGSWTNPENLGATFNSGADAILCPTVTPDGKYMFFTKLTFNTNTGNVYWVSTNFIDSLRTKTNIKSNKTSYLDIYPNPNNGKFTIDFSNKLCNRHSISIYDMQGKLLLSETSHDMAQAIINLKGFPLGMYMVKVITSGVSYEEKITKK